MTDGSGSDKSIAAHQRLIVALDLASPREARELVLSLGDAVSFYKVGLELFLAAGWPLVDWLVARGNQVFLDLKLFDVPATVRSAVRQLTGRGIRFTTVHGNDAMLQAACEVKEDLQVLAVTVLTSLDRGDLEDLGFSCDPERLVLSRARRALSLGCDGVVSSGLEAAALRADIGDRLLIVTPGIRPVDNRPQDDQKRVVSVEDAFRSGADYIVVGRPIRNAPHPRQAALGIQETIARIFAGRGPLASNQGQKL